MQGILNISVWPGCCTLGCTRQPGACHGCHELCFSLTQFVMRTQKTGNTNTPWVHQTSDTALWETWRVQADMHYIGAEISIFGASLFYISVININACIRCKLWRFWIFMSRVSTFLYLSFTLKDYSCIHQEYEKRPLENMQELSALVPKVHCRECCSLVQETIISSGCPSPALK